jgi:hypothetical protein
MAYADETLMGLKSDADLQSPFFGIGVIREILKSGGV